MAGERGCDCYAYIREVAKGTEAVQKMVQVVVVVLCDGASWSLCSISNSGMMHSIKEMLSS